VIIKIDVSNAFNTTDRALTLDMISGRASRDYACGIKEGDVIGTVDTPQCHHQYLPSPVPSSPVLSSLPETR
jgi:hypothetical protein